jgi:hypothetical protein
MKNILCLCGHRFEEKDILVRHCCPRCTIGYIKMDSIKEVDMELKWFEVSKELPPKDGFYYITSSEYPVNFYKAYYDGYGFKKESDSYYENPSHWCYIPERKQRYGKVSGV